MNFIGHALASHWLDDAADTKTVRAARGFGAMMPDFTNLAGVRDVSTTCPEVTVGIARHHAADQVFHQLPMVVGLMRELGARLVGAGLRRGPARATAHVGIEMLLDRAWLDGEPAHRAWQAAIDHEPHLVFPDDAAQARWQRMHTRLRQLAHQPVTTTHDVIADRLVRTVAHRPLLALNDAEIARLPWVIASIDGAVVAAAARIRSDLQAGLQAHG